MPTAAVSEKPARVLLALRLLYLGLGIGVIRTVIVVLRHLAVRTPDVIITVKFAIWAIVLISIFQTSNGTNWARWLLMALFIVTIPLNFLPLISTFTSYPIDGLLGALQFALFVIALGLLFHPTASAWFAEGRGPTRS